MKSVNMFIGAYAPIHTRHDNLISAQLEVGLLD